MEKTNHESPSSKESGVATLIIKQVGFREKKIVRDKRGHYTHHYVFMIEGPSLEEDINNLKCVCTLQQISKYMKQQLAESEGKVDTSTVIVGDFNISLSNWENVYTLKNQQGEVGKKTTK